MQVNKIKSEDEPVIPNQRVKGIFQASQKKMENDVTQIEGNVDGLRLRHGRDGEIKDISLQNRVAIENVRNSAQRLHDSFVEHVDRKLLKMFDDFVQEVEKTQQSPHNKTLFNYDKLNKKQSPMDDLPDKEFFSRRSLLTELFESTHIQTIYHIFIAIMVLLFLNTVIYDFVDTGKINLDFELIQWTFASFHTVMAIWAVMKLSTLLLLYPGFQYWAYNRPSKNSGLWDYAWLVAYILYLCMLFYLPVVKVIENNLPPASSVVVLMEQVRLLMKVHAFVRSNVPRALRYDLHKDDDKENNIACPDFSKYLYFLFAPTMVYRDHYPRSPSIQWQYVVSNFAQVVGCLFYTYFVFVRFCVPVFHKFGQEPMSSKNMVLSVFGVMLPSALVLLCGFFALLHSWLNAFAEMLRFADRMFYKDWWNSTSFANYYRTWNVVVHDWLYTYVYKDVHNLVKRSGRTRLMPKIVVFTVSAAVHEYILAFTFRFFYPILFILFGNVGVFFIFLTDKRKERVWNVFMWVALFIGMGFLMSLYSMEYYARINCPPVFDSFIDFITPRSWMCNAVASN